MRRVFERGTLMKRIVLIGDSITYGENASSRKNSWAAKLDAYLKSELKGQFEVINNGTSGETAQEGFDEVEDRVIKYTPDIVFIGYGTNDCTKEGSSYNNGYYNFESNIEDIAESIRDQTNATIVFNLAPPVIEELCSNDIFKIYNKDLKAYNDIVKKVANSMTLAFIDHYRLMSDRDDLKELIDTDGIHPNDKGHEVMFNNIISCTAHLFR